MNDHEILAEYLNQAVDDGTFLSANVTEYAAKQHDGVVRVVMVENGKAVTKHMFFKRDLGTGEYSYFEMAGSEGDSLQMTPAEFLRRFTMEERIAIRAASLTDPVIKDAEEMLYVVNDVRLDHPDTINFVNYLGSQGILATDRVTAILTP